MRGDETGFVVHEAARGVERAEHPSHRLDGLYDTVVDAMVAHPDVHFERVDDTDSGRRRWVGRSETGSSLVIFDQF